MSNGEITSIQHLRRALDHASWTDDLPQFKRQCQYMRSLVEHHLEIYSELPRDIVERVTPLLLENDFSAGNITHARHWS